MKNICFDIDDVLNNLMQSWLKSYNLKNRIFNKDKKEVKYEEIIENPPHNILKISEDEYRNSLYLFRIKNYDKIDLNYSIFHWFKENGNKAHFSVLTSAFKDCIPCTSNWVFRYFGEWIRTFGFIPSKINKNDNHIVFDKSKAEWLKRNNIDIFIDDSVKNIQGAKDIGIKKCYLVKKPWNNGIEVEEILKEINKELY